jgi:hypothetical protein
MRFNLHLSLPFALDVAWSSEEIGAMDTGMEVDLIDLHQCRSALRDYLPAGEPIRRSREPDGGGT